MLDKLKDEFGVFGIYGHAESAKMTYLGLYALRHRGQESGGIVASDGLTLRASRGMGYVADVFGAHALDDLQGTSAIGHVRYSTAGESRLVNAQPLLIDCVHGPIAVCHNGNLVNERDLRAALSAQGAIFQTSSDTEVFLHLYARSKAMRLEDALIEAVAQAQGAFSLLFLTRDRLVAVQTHYSYFSFALRGAEVSYLI